MKKLFLIMPLLLLLSGFIYNRILDDKIKQLLNSIQLSEDRANDIIFYDCMTPSFGLPNLNAIKGMALGDRTSLVETVGKYTKEYLGSKDFIKKYNDFRETKKPTPPQKPKSIDEQKKEQKEALKKGIENLEKAKTQLPKDQHATFNEAIKSYKEQLKEIDNPDNSMYNVDMEKTIQQVYEGQVADYNQKVAEWNKEYPKDNPKPLIKNWLQSFLDQSKDIDYKAETAADQYGKKIFVNQKYEAKDSFWKNCYRAGKEPVEAARKFAQKWLSELN